MNRFRKKLVAVLLLSSLVSSTTIYAGGEDDLSLSKDTADTVYRVGTGLSVTSGAWVAAEILRNWLWGAVGQVFCQGSDDMSLTGDNSCYVHDGESCTCFSTSQLAEEDLKVFFKLPGEEARRTLLKLLDITMREVAHSDLESDADVVSGGDLPAALAMLAGGITVAAIGKWAGASSIFGSDSDGKVDGEPVTGTVGTKGKGKGKKSKKS